MTYSFQKVALEDSLQTSAREAFKEAGRMSPRVEVLQSPRTVEAIKLGLDLDPFEPGEVFRAYPTIGMESCRQVVREITIRTTIEDASFIATDGRIEDIVDIFKASGDVPPRMWPDLVEFSVVDIENDIVRGKAVFGVPRSMEQNGWLLVFKPEEEVFG